MLTPLTPQEHHQVATCICKGFACGVITAINPFRTSVMGTGDDSIVVITAAGERVAGCYSCDPAVPWENALLPDDLIVVPERGDWSTVAVGDLAFNYQCDCPSHDIAGVRYKQS
jgi:hypothetical protein